MREVTFVLGGCRSGKSSHALTLAQKRLGAENCFIATCVPYDDEMNDRVRRHQAERGENWRTVDAPLELPETIEKQGRTADVMVVDCLTLWMNNLIMEDLSDEAVFEKVETLKRALDNVQCPVFVVSNEVGGGIVPENQLARRFRDLTGFANQRVAECANQVIWMVAGIPVRIKG
ncbi:MAG: bifunctional adenosylcobinamide kinase/adenosylcobinamide-phosphate guanylyltransferase [Desulfobacterales bacterium]|nr:bifunctional adenosylcobinamide kinase/adenosylcobinamide-phosphate guanylyltransferase [Desulfobacterales bacterium]